ncbi:MAG: hypothetical protein EAZ91_24095 [Cytophagales bacterium]|nr:MAG: hypothetical protein EAZ91_24095 [Cytophagales bacterium]
MYNQCRAFIGYEGLVYVPDDEDEAFCKKFIECENHAIVEFLTSEKSLSVCISEMKEKYINTYDEISEMGFKGILYASRLLRNLESLTFLGDISITIKDFVRQQ